ncbi:PREDICTED: dual specificity protein kinase TTK [Nanorana parkeri]|uniref:dual specificity protein kinase TTK n=1 Tax=Nanorana parkeri TaxID=125878 RepID=UPI00085404D7|nr:PREDICTED: dual specificity protein kinase TTK [Nanorana parkeri]
MDDEDISERKLKIASILDRVKKLKKTEDTLKHGSEDNWTGELIFTKSSADTTEHSGVFNHLLTPKNPEECLISLLRLENIGLPQIDHVLLNRLLDNYNHAVESLSAENHSHNESYAKILVRFAELKAVLDPDEARDQFQIARLNCKKFAFVHAAFAQFESSEGNFKKSKQILQRGKDCGAVPAEMIELALKNLQLRKPQLISEDDKENLSLSLSQHNGENGPSCALGKPRKTRSDSSGELSVNMRFLFGEKISSPEDCDEMQRKPLAHAPNKFGRVLVQSAASPDAGTTNHDVFPTSSVKRQPLSSLHMPVVPSLSKHKCVEDDIQASGNKVSSNSTNIASPTNQQEFNEDSVEMKTASSVIIRRTNPSITVRRDEDVDMDETDSTTALYNPPFNEQEYLGPQSDNKIDTKQPDPPKPNNAGMEWKWKIPEMPSDLFHGEGKRMSMDPSVLPTARRVSPPVAVTRCDPVLACRTPAKPQEDYMNCFRTPVVKDPLRPLSKFTTPCNNLPSYKLPNTPANPVLQPSAFPMTPSIASNECIVVKGRIYGVLKQIGTGGSSKVFQVMDEKKHLYAIKYVDLEEADEQTIESYQNEISHLNKLQQHCDKIIRLYDYEITKQHIYMVMECGNIDLNTWLRKKKTINPWERKSYWKNMLEAVHTIHQHGIVHSDLKPANFLIVDGMLKLIDFGIANQIQPDVTSIVKDSQVGTINYMPPEAIKDTTSFGENGKPRSKISPKGDVWSLGCILYCMTYGKTPFQHITNQITKLHAILDPSYKIEIPDIPEKDLRDVLKKCLMRNPKERISIAELLVHPYVQIQSRTDHIRNDAAEEMKRVLGQLIGLNSPNSISRAAKSLYEQYNSGKGFDLSTDGNQTSQNTWTTK